MWGRRERILVLVRARRCPSHLSMEPTKLEIPEIAGELWMYTHAANDIYISESIRNNRNWEPFETGVLAAHLRPGDTMVDLGANIGYYSLVAAAIVGDSGRVYAFEPDPGNFELLQRNIELNGFHQIHARNEAVSDAAGVTRLFLSAENQGDHRIYPAREEGVGRGHVDVACLDFDTFVEAEGISPDLVKIDTQGAEAAILRGMRRLAARQRGRMKLLVEFWPHGLRGAGSSPEEMLSILEGFGLRLSAIDKGARTLVPMSREEILETITAPHYTECQGFLNFLGEPVSEGVLE